ncbi:fasciclin domain-containing protein [Nonomuraea sp. NPDC047897]|uniref:fasciclin domain-containing protein n=1 Tax=Nonomuraea sp. NPDC047897 TaxID=3364346 RepID=UPI0037247A2C
MLLAAALALTATVTGSTSASALSSPPPTPEETATGEMTPAPGETTSPGEMTSPAPQGSPEGPGCSALEGALPGIADKPVASALGDVPDLSSLAEAVNQAGLADKLNQAEDITVFAPSNDAFDAIPQEAKDRVMADKEELTRILTYHVVEGRKAPADMEDVTLKTLEGGELTTKGSGEDLTINDAKVTCGNISTGNATVYVIDKVLMPQ